MRILLLAPSRSDPAHRRVLAALAGRLRASGDEVSVFPPPGRSAAADPRRALERLLQEKRIEVCHVHWFSRGLGYLGRARLPRGLKLVLTHQGASLALLERPEAFARLARQAQALTAVSCAGLEELLAGFPEARRRSCCIPNGTDLGLGAAAAWPRPFILSVGRLSAYKGTDILLLAFAGLAAEEPGLDLLVCGPDQAQGRLARFAARLGLGRRVRLLGDVPAARVGRLLRGCLFFVLPSRQENLPMALLEAMAAGKAVLACSVGGVKEIVTHGKDGLLVEPRDPAALAAAMLRLARDRRLRERLGRRARGRARHFDWSEVAARYRRLYASLSP